MSRHCTLTTAEIARPSPGEAQVWSARLDAAPPELDRWSRMLHPDERKRAANFVHERHRCRFIAARGILREILAAYLGIAPSELGFVYGAFGKPSLAGEAGLSGLDFNLSHAGGRAVCVVASRRRVGIDMEPLGQDLPWRQLAPWVFSARERSELAGLPEEEKAEAFLRGWTRKEAYVKGRGEGLSRVLTSFDVPLGRLVSPRQVTQRGSAAEAGRWWIQSIDSVPGHVAALAVEGDPVEVSVGEWRRSTGFHTNIGGICAVT